MKDRSSIERLRSQLSSISAQLATLKKEVLENGFENQAAEIHFFKHTKPRLYAQQIYEADRYAISSNCPAGTADMRRAYYEQELLYTFRLFRIHAFHYQYYRTGATILDHQYFTRDGRPADIPALAISIEPDFSTPLDYLFAKFIAAEQIQEYLLDQLGSTLKPAKPGPTLRWTGEAINLVEIAYGIALTGQVNDGNATITDIIHWLEKNLDIKIGVPAKRWEQLAARKHDPPTKYLDRMRQTIQQRLDAENSIPDRKRPARRTN